MSTHDLHGLGLAGPASGRSQQIVTFRVENRTFGVEVVGPTEEVVSKLADKGITIGKARLTDLTLAGAHKAIYSAVLNTLLASDHCDLVLAVAGSSAQFQPQVAIEPLLEADTKGKTSHRRDNSHPTAWFAPAQQHRYYHEACPGDNAPAQAVIDEPTRWYPTR